MNKEINSLHRQNDRNVGIDFLRVVAMGMIVLLHCFNVGGILENVDKGSLNYYIYNFIFVCVYGGVNLYALTTGYVCVYSKHRVSRIVNLWYEVFFYSVIIGLVFYFLTDYQISFFDFILNFCPFLSDRYWYFTAYVLLFLLIPIINSGIKNISKDNFKIILIFLFILCTVVQYFGSVVGYYSLDVYFLNGGLSFLWIFVLYLFGAYIRMYSVDKGHKIKFLIMYFIFSFLEFFIKFTIKTLFSNIDAFSNLSILSYCSPFLVIASIAMFYFFKDLKINFGKNAIIKLSSVTFSIYLISTHPYVAGFIQKDIFSTIANNLPVLIISVLCFAITIYFVSAIIGFAVKKLFKIVHLYSLTDIIILKTKKTIAFCCKR